MKISKYVSRIFFPRRCIHCGSIIPFADDFCQRCSLRECAVPEGFCFHCNSRECHCEESRARLSHISAPFIYTDSAKRLLTELKFKGKSYSAELISEEIARKVISDYPDVRFDFVTFVPMSDNAERRRGYNQSEVLARKVAEKLLLPCREALEKIKDTPKQHYLNASGRRQNLADAIVLKEGTEIKGKTVLVLDDIKTTGSTLMVCEEVLLSAGARDVYCAVAAIPVFGNMSHSIDKKDKKL